MSEATECKKNPRCIEFYKLTMEGHEKLFRSKINAIDHIEKCLGAYRHAPEDNSTVIMTVTLTRHRLNFLD